MSKIIRNFIKLLEKLDKKLVIIKPVAYCQYCNRPIFDKDAPWFNRKECVYCYSSYKRGVSSKLLGGDRNE